MTVKFHKRIYKKNAVNRTMDVFKEAASFQLGQKGNYHIVTINNIDRDIKETIKDEFCNYVIYFTNAI
jgi:hypothetical protein